MIPVYEPIIGDEEVNNTVDCLKRRMISGTMQGDYVGKFEQLVSESCHAHHGVSTTSGTTALALAVASLGLASGDEVLVPTLTNIASAFAVVYTGAKPVFVDSEERTWNLDISLIRQSITPRTRAIMVVHLYGHPVDMDAVMEIAKEYGLYVIEDAAEAHGAEYRGRRVGAIGHVGCLSFFVNKVVTTGEGGMLLTNDDQIAERARFLKNLGYANRDKFLHTDLAYNFRFTNLQAAVGVAQMSRFHDVIEQKRNLAAMYTSKLRGIRSLQLPVEESWAKNIYWMYSVVLQDGLPERQTVRDRLSRAGVETRNFFHPMHKQPAFQKMGYVSEADSLPIAEKLGARGLYLPSSPSLTEEEVDTICQRVREALEVTDVRAQPEMRALAGV